MISGLITAFISIVTNLPLVLGYLKGQAFHQPFTPEEEKIAIERFLAGDMSARDELIERNMRLVAHVVKKFHPKHELLDDYISIGTIGLMKAVNSYTPTKKTKLATYAARCIENEILMYLRTQKKVQKDVSLFDPIGMDKDGQSLQIADLLQTDDDSPVDAIALEVRTVLQKPLVLFIGAETHNLFDAAPVVPAAIENHHLTGGGEMSEVTLHVDLGFFPFAGCGQGDDFECTWAHPFGDAFDGTALAGCIPAFEYNDYTLPRFLYPVLQLDQFTLQFFKLGFVFLLGQFRALRLFESFLFDLPLFFAMFVFPRDLELSNVR